MSKLIIRGPADCEDSEFSTYEIEEKIREIDGVIDIYGDEFGLPFTPFTENPVVVLDKRYKAREDEIKAEIRSLLGETVKYLWHDRKG